MNRRDMLKTLGLAATGVAAGAVPAALMADGGTSRYGGGDPNAPLGTETFYPTRFDTQRYTYYEQLPPFDPRTPLEPNEMRIAFMGSVVPQFGRAQRMMSIFVEVGWAPDEYQLNDPNRDPNAPPPYQAEDHFVFDCGSGVAANYSAMNVGFLRMDKIFISHLHGDHMSDLTHIYDFGPSSDRKSPLFVWGPGPSGVPNPGNDPEVPDNPARYSADPAEYDDGTKAFCANLREANRWHTESFSFQTTAYRSYVPPTKESWGLPCDPVPVGDDPINDAFALVPIELDWTKTGLDADGKPTGDNVAYNNPKTRVKITHFPVIHCRQASVGFKLEWTPPGATKPLTMIYTSDTKPEWNSVNHAINRDANGTAQGVDVFIHEMAVPPEVWAMKNQGLDAPPPGQPDWWVKTVEGLAAVQNSSHTAQGAFGYLLSLINAAKPPGLTVATHFPTTDDTVASALKSVQAHCQEIQKVGEQLTWSYDCMVIRVFPDRIEQRRGAVLDHTFAAYPVYSRYDVLPPKYHDEDGTGNPLMQLNTSAQIPPTDPDGTENYRTDGY